MPNRVSTMTGRLRVALLATLVAFLVVPYSAVPASAADPVNDIEKSGVAQNPAGSTTQTLEGTNIDWTIDYTNTSTEVQSNVNLSDTTSSNLQIVAGSAEAPPGWVPTYTSANKIDFNAENVAPRGSGYAISTKPTAKSVNGGQGGGDGYVPLFGSDGNIYFTYHHNDGTIQCINPDTGTVCPGYPLAMNVNSGGVTGRMWVPNSADGTTVIGTRLYASGIVAGTPAYTYGLGCWDLVTRANCADQPYITFPHPAGFANASGTQSNSFAVGPYVIANKMYVWTSHQEVQCVDLATWAGCAGYPVSMKNDTTFPRVAANGISAGEVNGSQLYFAWAYGLSTEVVTQVAGVRVNCFDTATAAPCSGWADSGGASDGKAMVGNNANIWDIYFRFDSSGFTPTGICQTSYTNTGGCNSLADGTQLNEPGTTQGIPPALYNKIHFNGTSSGVISHAKHPSLPRSYFSAYGSNVEICWDWSTGNFCTAVQDSPGDLNYIDTAPGDGYVGDLGYIRPGNISTRDYGARLDTTTGCWWSLGDANILWSFDDSGNVPCIPRIVEAAGSTSFAGSFCSTGVPSDIAWNRAAVENLDVADWVSFVINVKNPSGTTVATFDAATGATSVDLSGVDASLIDTLTYEIDGAMAPGRDPLTNPATTPIVTIEYATSMAVQFCYQTRTVGDACTQVVATNNAVFKLADGTVEDTSTRSFDVIADPVGKCFTPAMTLAKTIYSGHDGGASCPGAETALVRDGDDVTWCLTVTNTGDTDLDSITITDANLPGSPFSVPGQLAQGASTTIHVEGTAGAADLTNSASTTGRAVDSGGAPIPGASVPTAGDTASYDVRTPGLTLTKTAYAGHDGGASCGTATAGTQTNIGGDVTWCFTVNNTGDTDLIDVSIDDPTISAAPITVPGTIAPASSGSTYLEGTTSVDTVNNATASGAPATGGTAIPGFPRVTGGGSATVDVVTPGVRIDKTVVAAGGTCPGSDNLAADAGDAVIWCFTVTNTGDTHLTNVSIADADLPGSPFTIAGVIAPTASASTSVAGTASADLTNTAYVAADPSDAAGVVYGGVTPPSDNDTASIDVVAPGITLEKTVALGSGGLASCPGVETVHSLTTVDDAVTWCFTVSNTGDTQLTDITITDPDLVGSPFVVGDLDPGFDTTFATTGVADTTFTNLAQVTGTPADMSGVALPGVTPPSASDTAAIVEDAPAEVNGRLFHDVNGDGDDESGTDPGLGSVTVTLTGTDINGNPVSIDVQTAPDGSYTVPGLLPSGPGGYTIAVDRNTVPAQYTIDTTALSANVDVAAGDSTDISPFGVTSAATISGLVFGDNDGDGTVEGGEDGVGGVRVTLAGNDALGNPVIREAFTEPDGTYSFVGLPPSDGAGYTITLDESSAPARFTGVSTPTTDAVVVASGDSADAAPFGLIEPGSVSGSIFEDVDGDGTDDPTDRDLGGVTVTITGTDSLGNPVSMTTTTNPDGTYSFADLPPSDGAGYTVALDVDTLPPGIRTPSTPLTRTVSVTGGEETSAAPMGVYAPATASGTVFTDYDVDGIQDSGEAGLGGVTVILEGTDGLGNPVSLTTTTNPDGTYDFADLAPSGPDGYTVRVDASTLPPESSDSTLPATRSITPTSGSNHPDLDFGVFAGADVAGQVFLDNDADTTVGSDERGLAGVTITLTGTDVNGNPISRSVVTGPNGTYTFADVPTSGPDGYTVAVDPSTVPSQYSVKTTAQSASVAVVAGTDVAVPPFGVLEPGHLKGVLYNDANDDGVQNPGEAGIPNARITLTGTDISGKPVDITVTTGPDGSYDFGDLMPSDVNGYTVTVDPSSVPEGMNLVGGNQVIKVAAGETANVRFRAISKTASTGSNSPNGTTPSSLSFTGASVAGPLTVGLLLLAVGAAMVGARRRRALSTDDDT